LLPLPLALVQLDPFDLSWRSRLELVLASGRAAGASLVEVFLESTDHIGLLAEQDSITNVSPAFGKGAGIRVFREERDGFVSTNDLSERGLMAALEQALGMLGLERGSSDSSRFDGLSGLRDYGQSKQAWLDHCPGLGRGHQPASGGHRPARAPRPAPAGPPRQLCPRLAGGDGGRQ